MASDITNKKSSRKSKKRRVAPTTIQITLTTFSADENGELCPVATTDNVKIDGEVPGSSQDRPAPFDWSPVLRSTAVRNLLVLSVGQFLLFAAFDSLSNLQLALNGQDLSMGVVYGVAGVSSLLFTPAAARWLGCCKRALVVGGVGFWPYVLAHFFSPPRTWLLLPAGVVCGVAWGLTATARCAYVNRIARRFSARHRLSRHVTNAWFFSVCLTVQLNSEIWGNLLAHCVLGRGPAAVGSSTGAWSDDINECGSDFCDVATPSGGPLWSVSGEGRYVLVSLYSGLALAAVFFTAFFLHSEQEESEEDEDEDEEETMNKRGRGVCMDDFVSVFRQFSRPDQILLVPLSLYTGMFLGFYKGDYAKAYVACAWGVPHVTLVSLCYGVVSVVVGSAGAPCLVTLGRSGLFLLAAIAHLAMFLALFIWKPDSLHATGFFLVAGAAGIGNGVWTAQIAALYGVLFPETEVAAFSAFHFLQAAGFALSRSLDFHPCTYPKLFAPPAALALGIVCYLAVEVRAERRSNNKAGGGTEVDR